MPKRKFKSLEVAPLIPSLDFITDPNWKPEAGTILVLYNDKYLETVTPFGVVQRTETDKAMFRVRLINFDEKVVNLTFSSCTRKALKVTPNEISGKVSVAKSDRDLVCRCRRVKSKAAHAWKVDVTDNIGETVSDCYVKIYYPTEEYIIPYYWNDKRVVEVSFD